MHYFKRRAILRIMSLVYNLMRAKPSKPDACVYILKAFHNREKNVLFFFVRVGAVLKFQTFFLL